MLRLPPLVAGSQQWSLPLSDRSAACLAELLVARPTESVIASLAERLATDPPLVLWSVCQAGQHGQPPPRRLGDLGAWLAEDGSGALQWPADEGQADEPDERAQAWFADRVAADLETAALAADLAAFADDADAEEAYLLGLLTAAAEWLSKAGPVLEETAVSPLPDWLVAAAETPAGRHAEQAAAIVAGQQDGPALGESAREDCRRHAADGRRLWLAAVPGAGALLPELADKLNRLTELETRFEETLEREKIEALAEFSAGAGHEINNPLTVIVGRARLFLGQETDPERRRGLALMIAQAMRVNEMIADLRLFSRPPAVEPEPFDLIQAVDAVIEEVWPEAAERAISLARPELEPLEIEADRTQIMVALKALVENSVQAVGRDGHVELAAALDGDTVRITVRDDGPGIPPHVRRHLFDPFFSGREAGRGLGLGLSKCWRIVTNHGGRIHVDSPAARGSTFTITLPRVYQAPVEQ